VLQVAICAQTYKDIIKLISQLH